MRTSHQKERELEQLEKAFKILGITYEIIEKDKESPDFIVKIDGQFIGVEITEFYRDLGYGKSAKTESDLPIIVEESMKIYNQKKGIPFTFGVGFNGTVAVKNRSDISRDLAEFLFEQTKQLSSQSYELHNIIPDKIKYPSLHIINSIIAKRIDNENAVGFLTSSFNSIQVELNVLEFVIQKKTALLSSYRQRCDIIWLLIILPSMKLAGDFILPDAGFTIRYEEFDAIYILDDYQDKIQHINKAM